jgi:type I restriction enzyme, R subunit
LGRQSVTLKLDTRFAYATNGEDLWRGHAHRARKATLPLIPRQTSYGTCASHEPNQWRDAFRGNSLQDTAVTGAPRYYIDIAVNRALDAIANGKDRILLTLATGTGKTFIAFQIAWKLFHSRWNLGEGREAQTSNPVPG